MMMKTRFATAVLFMFIASAVSAESVPTPHDARKDDLRRQR